MKITNRVETAPTGLQISIASENLAEERFIATLAELIEGKAQAEDMRREAERQLEDTITAMRATSTAARIDELVADNQRLAREANELKADNERLNVQLAGCGVVAMADTRDGQKNRAKQSEYGWSASYGDVCRMVDKLIDFREESERLKRISAECIQFLESAGYGKPGEANTLWGMVKQASADIKANTQWSTAGKPPLADTQSAIGNEVKQAKFPLGFNLPKPTPQEEHLRKLTDEVIRKMQDADLKQRQDKAVAAIRADERAKVTAELAASYHLFSEEQVRADERRKVIASSVNWPKPRDREIESIPSIRGIDGMKKGVLLTVAKGITIDDAEQAARTAQGACDLPIYFVFNGRLHQAGHTEAMY